MFVVVEEVFGGLLYYCVVVDDYFVGFYVLLYGVKYFVWVDIIVFEKRLVFNDDNCFYEDLWYVVYDDVMFVFFGEKNNDYAFIIVIIDRCFAREYVCYLFTQYMLVEIEDYEIVIFCC